jgi:pimeloyl-ACP methyl ester carboxylesterase
MAHAGPFEPHHALVTAAGASPDRWLLVLHGVFGSGDNFRLFARKLCEACPGWGVCLVDLRGHGRSTGAPPPHTLDAAAEDLLRLEARLGLRIGAVAGHSFGGKVALDLLLRRTTRVEHAFLLDSPPGAGAAAGDARDVLALLRGVPQPLASRDEFLALVESAGYARPVAEWLAMNVRRTDDGFRLRLELDAIEALLDDYFARDLWRVVEAAVGTDHMHVIVGGRSDVVGAPDRERFAAVAQRTPAVKLHVLERAGHWVHVDDPDGVLAVVTRALGVRSGV